jgi:hypothetical protein
MNGMDPAVKALLLSLAETLDPGALGPLSDRLEELGDERAGKVREILAHPAMAVIHTDKNDWGSLWGGRPVYCPERDCLAALALFPEGPRWFLLEMVPGGERCLHGLHLTPGDAAAAAERHNRGMNLSPARAHGRPYWPSPPAAGPVTAS